MEKLRRQHAFRIGINSAKLERILIGDDVVESSSTLVERILIACCLLIPTLFFFPSPPPPLLCAKQRSHDIFMAYLSFCSVTKRIAESHVIFTLFLFFTYVPTIKTILKNDMSHIGDL